MKSAAEWAREVIRAVAESKQDWDEDIKDIVTPAFEQAIREAQVPRPALEEAILSDKELSEIDERHRASTAGEWACPDMTMSGICFVETEADFGHGMVKAILGQMAIALEEDQARRYNRANAVFAACSHQDIPALLHDLRQAYALIADMQEDGTSDRLQARLDREYRTGFGEGMAAAQERWREQIRKTMSEEGKRFMGSIGAVPATPEQAALVQQAFDPDFPDDTYDDIHSGLEHLESQGGAGPNQREE
jgi:hypothetical protein